MITTDDTNPRFRPVKGQTSKVFWHPCSMCGSVWGGSIGVNYNPRKGMLGTWYCSECFVRKNNDEVQELDG